MLFFLEEGHGGGGHAESFNPLHFEPGMMFWTSVTFVILLLILRKVAWGPLTKAVEEREEKIRNDIAAAEKARSEAEAAQVRLKTQLDQAAVEAKRLLDEARAAAERAKAEIVNQARTESESLRERAAKDIAAARDKAIADIRGQIVDVAMSVSQRFLSKSIDRKEHERLADEALVKAGDLRS
jgi:F-type H+-transporting ATPase subunit b